MQYRELNRSPEGQRTIAIVLDHGDELMASLQVVIDQEDLSAASFTAIGAFERLTLAYFDWASKSYEEIPVDEQVEVASLTGDVARKADGSAQIHAHGVVATRTGETRGGHVMRAEVRPTLEIVLQESPAHLARVEDTESGLALIDLGASSRS